MRFPNVTRLLPVALAAALIAPASAHADEAPVSDQIIVRHAPGLSQAELADVRADADTTLERRLRLADTEVLTVEEGTRAQALAELRADPDVLWAAPNGIARTASNDPYWPNLYALQNAGLAGRRVDADIDAEQAWTRTRGAGVTVAVVDSGVQADHPDLVGRVSTTSAKDFVDGDTDASDLNGHGTHVAGIIAATKDNGAGVAGIAPEATIMPVRVLDASGEGTWAAILDGFAWAATRGAKVVNASIGGPYHPALALAFDQLYATYPGTLFVVSAGNSAIDNDTPSQGSLPCVANAANQLCVGSSTDQDSSSWFSNRGATTVDVFAPGSAIVSTVAGSGYTAKNGTSMAAPYVAGTAALVVAQSGKVGQQAATAIKDTVDRPAALAGLSVTGGRINAARAVGAAVDPPTPAVVESVTGGTNTATITMAQRESDLDAYAFTMDGAHIGTVSGRAVTVDGLAAGAHTFTVQVRNTSGMIAAPSAPITVNVAGPVKPQTAPAGARQRPGTATTTTATGTGAVSQVRVVRRAGRQFLTFRVARTSRVTLTLARRSGSTYRRAASKTVRLTTGMQSLPVTSRLLGMRVPRGRLRVSVGTSTATAASVTFTKR